MSQSYNAYPGPRGPLQHRCGLCETTRPNLLRCAGCRIVRYCSREHQIQDRSEYKELCKEIGGLRAGLEREDHIVRNATTDNGAPLNAFESLSGRFHISLPTREYIEARYAMAFQARRAGTLDGVTEALEHFQDIVWLCRVSSLTTSNHVPALLMRLGRDQECYDFIVWTAKSRDISYDSGNTDLPFLDIKDADVLGLDTLKTVISCFDNIDFLAIVLLIKVKLLIDIRNLKVARKVLHGLPVDLCLEVERHAVQSPISLRLVSQSYGYLLSTEVKLMKHCHLIKCKISEKYPQFMAELADLRIETKVAWLWPCDNNPFGLMSKALEGVYPAWWETPNALELVRAAFHAVQYRNFNALHEYLGHQGTRLPSMPQEVHKRKRRDPAPYDPDTLEPFEFILIRIIKNSSYLGPKMDIETKKRKNKSKTEKKDKKRHKSGSTR